MVKCFHCWLVVFLILSRGLFAEADDEEFMLAFRYPAVGSCYVRAVYSEGKVYLPLGEILSLLYISCEKSASGMALKGTFPEDTSWEVNPGGLFARKGRETFLLNPDDFRTGFMDLFLLPAVYEQLFGLHFNVDRSKLNLTLQSEHILPAEERQKRNDLRRKLKCSQADSSVYPLLYPRQRKLAAAGFADYSAGIQLSTATNNLNYTITGGMELLAGDIQGTFRGFHSRACNVFNAGNVHWRWVLPENPVLSSVRAGQIVTAGLVNRQVIGCAVTNDPVMPRQICGMQLVDGKTVPGSEVELFVNNQLAGFTYSDELGYYHFDFPLNYGTVRTSLNIYTPDGRIISEEKHMQIPYTFLPKEKVTYNFQGGFLPEGTYAALYDRQVVHGDVACGITKGLTAKIGGDYFGPGTHSLLYCSIYSRLFEQYLLNVDVAPDALFRVNAGVTYPSGRSVRFSYAEYSGMQGYAFYPVSDGLSASLFLPVKLFGLSSGIRFRGEHQRIKNEYDDTHFRIGLNMRPGRANLRFGYLEHLRNHKSGFHSYRDSRITAAATWNFPRKSSLPHFVKGMFLRLQVQTNIRKMEWNAWCIELSRSLGKHSRIQMNAHYYYPDQCMYLQGILTVDLPSVRSVTRINFYGNQYNVMQNFSGSVAVDAGRRHLRADNRGQAGQCAASIRMFIDTNHDGIYNTGEEKIPATAVRINRGAAVHAGKDSILRITRLHNYWRYEAEIVQSALPNPTLAPVVHKFSFDADPNRFKPIDIPLYRTGVIEGTLFLKTDSEFLKGLAGARIFLRCRKHDFEKILHTFSDGGFYAMNLLPGEYTLEVDPVQIGFLNAQCIPQKLEFEIKPVADGDYIEELEMILVVSE